MRKGWKRYNKVFPHLVFFRRGIVIKIRKEKLSMEKDKHTENLRAVRAASGNEEKSAFLAEERDHILFLTARILRHTVTDSDDEFSIALMAVSEALDSYNEEKGNFWGYASLVIKSRIYDEYRKRSRRPGELLIDPVSFGGDIDDEDTDADISVKKRIKPEDRSLYRQSLKG